MCKIIAAKGSNNEVVRRTLIAREHLERMGDHLIKANVELEQLQIRLQLAEWNG
jgi:hypothetical protein